MTIDGKYLSDCETNHTDHISKDEWIFANKCANIALFIFALFLSGIGVCFIYKMYFFIKLLIWIL
jgi:hypothetical protein